MLLLIMPTMPFGVDFYCAFITVGHIFLLLERAFPRKPTSVDFTVWTLGTSGYLF